MDFFSNIRNKYSSLSSGNKKIADYIMNYPDDALSSSATKIGEKSETSPATVIRFVRNVGYSSLEEMKISLAKSIQATKDLETLDPIISREDTTEMLIKKLGNMIIMGMQDLIAQLDVEKLDSALKYLRGVECIYIYGIGSSGLAAYDLYHKLNRVNIRARYDMDTHMTIEFSNYTTKKDAVIAFSYSGETKEILIAARRAKKNGTKIISVTGNLKSKLAELSDIIISVPRNEHMLRVAAISSKFSSMLISDMLYLGIVHKDFDKIEKGIIEVLQLARELRK